MTARRPYTLLYRRAHAHITRLRDALVFAIAALLSSLLIPGLAQAASPIIIDNSSAQFTTYGTWPASTAVTGYEGPNYQTHEAKGNPPGAIVVDNSDAGFSVTGTWPTSTSVGGYYGTNYQVHAANGEEPSAIVVDNTAGTFVKKGVRSCLLPIFC